jgi:hypothetical protein
MIEGKYLVRMAGMDWFGVSQVFSIRATAIWRVHRSLYRPLKD